LKSNLINTIIKYNRYQHIKRPQCIIQKVEENFFLQINSKLFGEEDMKKVAEN